MIANGRLFLLLTVILIHLSIMLAVCGIKNTFGTSVYCKEYTFLILFDFWQDSPDKGVSLSQDNRTQTNVEIHLHLKWDSNPQSQCSSSHDPNQIQQVKKYLFPCPQSLILSPTVSVAHVVFNMTGFLAFPHSLQKFPSAGGLCTFHQCVRVARLPKPLLSS
jgi:hypothetical protein